MPHGISGMHQKRTGEVKPGFESQKQLFRVYPFTGDQQLEKHTPSPFLAMTAYPPPGLSIRFLVSLV